jgi:NAD(P)H-nitrite reductase large subunit
VELDDKICYCFHVTKRKILNFVQIHRPRRASQISQCGGAGTGCGWCVPILQKYHQQMMEGLPQAANDRAPDDLDRLTPAEYARRRGEYVRAGRGTPPSGATPLPPVN